MGRHRASVVIDSLDAHPNRQQILATLARLPHLADAELPRLADEWRNSVPVAEARQRALEPGSPLVIDALAAFDVAQALFADDLVGGQDYATVEPGVVSQALKAVRDAIAGAYAQPVLAPEQYAALRRPWRVVFPDDGDTAPDLGARAPDIHGLLAALARLATRCHDPGAAASYRSIAELVSGLDIGVHAVAREEAWRIAVLTSRRRLWHAVRREGTDRYTGACAVCRTRPHRRDDRVLTLGLDAVAGLLVADALDETLVDVLTVPVQGLVPVQRPAAG